MLLKYFRSPNFLPFYTRGNYVLRKKKEEEAPCEDIVLGTIGAGTRLWTSRKCWWRPIRRAATTWPIQKGRATSCYEKAAASSCMIEGRVLKIIQRTRRSWEEIWGWILCGRTSCAGRERESNNMLENIFCGRKYYVVYAQSFFLQGQAIVNIMFLTHIGSLRKKNARLWLRLLYHFVSREQNQDSWDYPAPKHLVVCSRSIYNPVKSWSDSFTGSRCA